MMNQNPNTYGGADILVRFAQDSSRFFRPPGDKYQRRFIQRIAEWLDQGDGDCLLRKTAIARIAGNTLLQFAEPRCDMGAFDIMPNHVHALFRLRSGIVLQAMKKSWKGISARPINQYLVRQGQV